MDGFPEFWNQIETNLDLDPNGIRNIKELLTLLEYKTIQSVTKLADKKQVFLLEREFTHFKNSNASLVADYPNLLNLKFCSGFISTLMDIAKKIKKRFIGFDHDKIESTVFHEIKKICSEIKMTHICVNSVNAEVNCVVTCPKCSRKSTLSQYWTKQGPAFRPSNFQRHYISHNSSVLSGETPMDRMVKQFEALRLRRMTLTKSNMLLKSRLPSQFKTQKMIHNAKEKDALQTHLNLALSEVNSLYYERKYLLQAYLDRHGKIHVYCRLRPILLNDSHIDKINYNILPNGNMEIQNVDGTKDEFTFKKVFEPNSKQFDVFVELKPLVQSWIDGRNICILSHGETGSGKKFTMSGENGENTGLFGRTVEFLFERCKINSAFGFEYKFSLTYFEVFNENLFDLLGSDSTEISITMTDGNIQICGLSFWDFSCREDLESILRKANERRELLPIKGISHNEIHGIISVRLSTTHFAHQINSQIAFIKSAGSDIKHQKPFMEKGSFLSNFLQTQLAGGCTAAIVLNVLQTGQNNEETYANIRLAKKLGSNSI